MIRPTLFIGLGTTGAEILSYLQDFIFEEYQQASFPVIKLLSIISAEGDARLLAKIPEEPGFNPVVPINIPNVSVLKGRYESPANPADQALKEWVAPALLKQTSYLHGAGNVRAVGRLFLWDTENYARICTAINTAAIACTSIASRNAADIILHRIATGNNVPPPRTLIELGLNVFVVGTLSGGTCSGMAPEFGYVLRTIPDIEPLMAGEWRIRGVFTIPSQGQTPDKALSTYARNAYTALSELNYFYYPAKEERQFQHILPGGESLQSNARPYEQLYVLSPANILNQVMVDPRNEHDHRGLLQMIAMSLFLDVASGAAAVKDGITVNLKANQSPKGETINELDLKPAGRKPRAYYSFGAAAISYPRYRLGRIVACDRVLKATEVLNGPSVEAAATASGDALWDDIANKVFPLLLRFPEGAVPPVLLGAMEQLQIPLPKNIEDDIEAECLLHPLLAMWNAAAVRKMIPKYYPPPPLPPFEQRLRSGGVYQVVIADNFTHRAQDALDRAVEGWFRGVQGNLNTGASLRTAISAVEKAEKRLEQEKTTYQGRVDEGTGISLTPEITGMLTYLDNLEHGVFSGWLWAMGLRPAACREYKQKIMRKYAEAVWNAVVNLCAPYQIQLTEQAQAKLREMKDKLQALQNLVGRCGSAIVSLRLEINNTIVFAPKCVRYVFRKNPSANPDKPEEVQKALSAEVEDVKGVVTARVPPVPPFDLFTGAHLSEEGPTGDEAKANRVVDIEVARIFPHVPKHNLAQHIRANWDASYASRVQFAAPCIELDDHYFGAGHRIPPPGGGLRAMTFCPRNSTDTLQQVPFPPIREDNFGFTEIESPSHVIFYCEEAGFSTTFMKSYNGCRAVYEQARRAQARSVLWTDSRWPDGPDLDLEPRIEFITFVLENTRDLMRGLRAKPAAGIEGLDEVEFRDGTTEDTGKFFRYRYAVPDGEEREGTAEARAGGSHIFEMPRRPGGQQINVTVGNRGDYERAAERTMAGVFIPYLTGRLTACLRPMGQRVFDDRCDRYCVLLQRKRDTDSGTALDEDTKKKIAQHCDDAIARMRTFQTYVQWLVWQRELSPDDRDKVGGYVWLST